MSKYEKLTAYLSASMTTSRCMGFREIEEVLGFALPASARKHRPWWANDPSPGRQSGAWLSVGWETAEVDLGGENVTFQRADQVPSRVPRQPKKSSQQAAENRSAARFVELSVAPDGGAVQLSLEMQWRTLGPLGVDADGAVLFPAAPNVPGLYRFRLTGKGGATHYIGETADLRRRFQHYRKPGPTQQTNIRINHFLLKHCAAGDQAELDIIVGDVVLVLGKDSAQADLSDRPTRRLLEHAALVAEGGKGIDSLNR